MAVLLKILTFLEILGILIVVLLAILLILALLFLFVPFRYSFVGSVNDPEGSTEVLHLDPIKDIFVRGDVRWFLGAIHASGAIGGTDKKEELIRMELRIFGRKLPVEKFRKWIKTKEKEEEEKEEAAEPEEGKTFEEKIEAVFARVEKFSRRIEDAVYVMQSEYGINAFQEIKKRALAILEAVLPKEWGLTGVIGLGDPARSAKVFALQGILYPVTAGHVEIGTDFDLYRYDLRGTARGGIRIFTFVRGGILILFSKDVRRVFRRLRRGPAPAGQSGRSKGRKGKGNGNGNGSGNEKAA